MWNFNPDSVRVQRHNAAVICVARRRYDLIQAMLTTATNHDPNYNETLENLKKVA